MIRARLRTAATSLLLAGLLAAGLIPLARGQKAPGPAPDPGTPPPESPNASAGAQAQGRRLPAFVEARPVTGPGRVFRLRIVADDTGKPIPHANVRVWIAFRDEWRTADADGRLDILHSTGPADDGIGVDVWGDGYAMQRHHWGESLRPGAKIPDEGTIRLRGGESLGGIVQDEQGRPIAGAAVYLWSHNYKHNDPHEILYDLRATTGPDGRWRTGGAPETTGDLLGIYITHPNYISDREYSGGRKSPPSPTSGPAKRFL